MTAVVMRFPLDFTTSVYHLVFQLHPTPAFDAYATTPRLRICINVRKADACSKSRQADQGILLSLLRSRE
jgi:hypothetical protein